MPFAGGDKHEMPDSPLQPSRRILVAQPPFLFFSVLLCWAAYLHLQPVPVSFQQEQPFDSECLAAPCRQSNLTRSRWITTRIIEVIDFSKVAYSHRLRFKMLYWVQYELKSRSKLQQTMHSSSIVNRLQSLSRFTGH